MARCLSQNAISTTLQVHALQSLVILSVAGIGLFFLSIRTYAEAPTGVTAEGQTLKTVSDPLTNTLFLPIIQKPLTPSIPPGTYPFTDKCMIIPIPPSGGPLAAVTACIPSIVIGSDGTMQFNMTWTAQVYVSGYCVSKGSDAGNRNMYATDNLGQRYDTLQVGGAAAYYTIICDQQTKTGWYLFPPAQPGANVFTFHDDDQHKSIDQLVLPLQ